MSKQLTDYHGIHACISMQDPQNIRVVNHYQMTLDGGQPTDTFKYDSTHQLRCVTLWGKNPDVLKKAARQLLCRSEPIVRPLTRHEPSTALVFTQP